MLGLFHAVNGVYQEGVHSDCMGKFPSSPLRVCTIPTDNYKASIFLSLCNLLQDESTERYEMNVGL